MPNKAAHATKQAQQKLEIFGKLDAFQKTEKFSTIFL
jgi:hypothetical protein